MLSTADLLRDYPLPHPYPTKHAKREAAAQGKLLFWSNRACPKHATPMGYDTYVTLRYTKSSNCFKCAKEASLKKSRAQHALRSRLDNARAREANPELASLYFCKPSVAARNGHEFYFSGKPCPAGHNTLRYTCNGACMTCLGRTTLPPPPPPIV